MYFFLNFLRNIFHSFIHTYGFGINQFKTWIIVIEMGLRCVKYRNGENVSEMCKLSSTPFTDIMKALYCIYHFILTSIQYLVSSSSLLQFQSVCLLCLSNLLRLFAFPFQVWLSHLFLLECWNLPKNKKIMFLFLSFLDRIRMISGQCYKINFGTYFFLFFFTFFFILLLHLLLFRVSFSLILAIFLAIITQR